MATQWRGKDRNLYTGNADFLDSNALNEVVLSKGHVEGVQMDTQSCMDDSILAIFEDSTVASEDKSGVEEETLLSTLTEILDSVEDDDGTLSPFDILPDAELLTDQEHRDNSPLRRLLSLAGAPLDRDPGYYSPSSSSVKEESIADRLRRPSLRSPNVVFRQRSDGEEDCGSQGESDGLPRGFKQPSQKSLHYTNSLDVGPTKSETEIEIFTSTSLVNLVKIMHPYCLRLHLEEEEEEEDRKGWASSLRQTASSWGKLRKGHTLSSQGEIWRYEKPSGDSDEEINVDVSDDETKEEEEGDDGRVEAKRLKSVLVNRDLSRAQPSREKKRVSFGSVQVATVDAPMEKESNIKELTSEITVSAPPASTKTIPLGPAPEPLTTPSSEINSDKAEVTKAQFVLPPQGETKAKSLSLQQYRQLRQKRLPLVEKQGNYTTKWPSLSETPKELTPILCLQGQRRNRLGPKTTQHHPASTRIGNDHFNGSKAPGCKTSRASLQPKPGPVETKPSNSLHHSGLKHQRTESKMISPASPSPSANLLVDVPQSRNSPEKKPPLLSSDPPNPVLLPLPVTQPRSDRASQPASPSTPHSIPEPKPSVVLLNRDSSLESTRLLREIQKKFSPQLPKIEPSSLEPNSTALLLNEDSTSLLQEIKKTFSKQPPSEEPLSSGSPARCPTTTETKSTSECKTPLPQPSSHSPTQETKLLPKIPQSPSPDLTRQTKCPSSTPYSTQPPTPANAPILVKERLTGASLSISPPEHPPPPPQLSCTVQSPTGDSGIEAPDLTSLLEQFEETQGKGKDKCASDLQATAEDISEACDQTRPPVEPLESQSQEYFSTSEMPRTEKTLRIPDVPEPLGTDVILSTRDRTSANQQWKLFPSTPRRKQPTKPQTPPSKAIQIIDPRPLPSRKTHTHSPSKPPATHTSSQMHLTVSSDHDYCVSTSAMLCSKTQTSTAKDIFNLTNKMQVTTHDPSATYECKKHTTACEAKSPLGPVNNSDKCVWQHLSKHHRARLETELAIDFALPFSDDAIPRQRYSSASDTREDRTKQCSPPTPPPSPPGREREKRATRRYRKRSPRSDSSSSSPSSSSSSSSSSRSRSRSPQRKRLRHKRSESSSCSSSPSRSRSVSRSPPRRYRLSYSRPRSSRSRSKSWSRSRSRSPSPRIHQRRWKDVYSPTYHRNSREPKRLKRQREMRIQKLKAIDERRVVYVGRIRRSMTHDELRERFSLFGEVECVSLHFRDRSDNYGFVTFYNMEDAFAAIENGSKLRKPDELPFDICFGGRRQFCNSDYADLDSNRDVDPTPAKGKLEELDFDSLLKQAQKGLKS